MFSLLDFVKFYVRCDFQYVCLRCFAALFMSAIFVTHLDGGPHKEERLCRLSHPVCLDTTASHLIKASFCRCII